MNMSEILKNQTLPKFVIVPGLCHMKTLRHKILKIWRVEMSVFVGNKINCSVFKKATEGVLLSKKAPDLYYGDAQFESQSEHKLY